MSDDSDHVLDGITLGRDIGTEEEPQREILARVGHLLWEEDRAIGEPAVGGMWVLDWIDGHRDEIGLTKDAADEAFRAARKLVAEKLVQIH